MWVAVVIDPLRSIALERPEFGAYRVYNSKYIPPANENPDGTIAVDDTTRAQRFGHSWNEYYELDITYFNSQLGSNILQLISSNTVWASILSSIPQLQPDMKLKLVDQINKINNKLHIVTQNSHTSSIGFSSGSKSDKLRDRDMDDVLQQAQNISLQAEKQCISMQVQQQLFQSFDAAQNELLNKHRAELANTITSAPEQHQSNLTLPGSNSSMQLS